MIFRAHKARIAELAASIEDDRARMRNESESMLAATRRVIGSPAGLAVCFAAGLLAAPLLRSVGRASANRLGVRALAAAAAWAWQTYNASQGPAVPGEKPPAETTSPAG